MSVKYSGLANTYKLYLENHWNYAVDIGSSESGNLTRIDNVIKSIPEILENTRIELEEIEKQLENAKEEIGKPFLKEKELEEKSLRLSELEKELDIGKNDDELDEEIPLNETKQPREYSR